LTCLNGNGCGYAILKRGLRHNAASLDDCKDVDVEDMLACKIVVDKLADMLKEQGKPEHTKLELSSKMTLELHSLPARKLEEGKPVLVLGNKLEPEHKLVLVVDILVPEQGSTSQQALALAPGSKLEPEQVLGSKSQLVLELHKREPAHMLELDNMKVQVLGNSLMEHEARVLADMKSLADTTVLVGMQNDWLDEPAVSKAIRNLVSLHSSYWLWWNPQGQT